MYFKVYSLLSYCKMGHPFHCWNFPGWPPTRGCYPRPSKKSPEIWVAYPAWGQRCLQMDTSPAVHRTRLYRRSLAPSLSRTCLQTLGWRDPGSQLGRHVVAAPGDCIGGADPPHLQWALWLAVSRHPRRSEACRTAQHASMEGLEQRTELNTHLIPVSCIDHHRRPAYLM